MFGSRNSVHPDIAAALRECRRAFGSVALFSGVVNLLMLAGPLYMLQIYDRVLSSRSVPTLIALSIFLVGAYAFQGALDLIRSRVIVRAAAALDQRLALTVHAAVVRLAVGARQGDAQQPVRDLDQIRSFLTGAGRSRWWIFPGFRCSCSSALSSIPGSAWRPRPAAWCCSR